MARKFVELASLPIAYKLTKQEAAYLELMGRLPEEPKEVWALRQWTYNPLTKRDKGKTLEIASTKNPK